MSFIKRQSTIDKPDSVNLVTPPKTTAPTTIPEQPASQNPTLLLRIACEVSDLMVFDTTFVVVDLRSDMIL